MERQAELEDGEEDATGPKKKGRGRGTTEDVDPDLVEFDEEDIEGDDDEDDDTLIEDDEDGDDDLSDIVDDPGAGKDD